jgi:hypothetical protein
VGLWEGETYMEYEPLPVRDTVLVTVGVAEAVGQ